MGRAGFIWGLNWLILPNVVPYTQWPHRRSSLRLWWLVVASRQRENILFFPSFIFSGHLFYGNTKVGRYRPYFFCVIRLSFHPFSMLQIYFTGQCTRVIIYCRPLQSSSSSNIMLETMTSFQIKAAYTRYNRLFRRLYNRVNNGLYSVNGI